jgi:hypothetical protein
LGVVLTSFDGDGNVDVLVPIHDSFENIGLPLLDRYLE